MTRLQDVLKAYEIGIEEGKRLSNQSACSAAMDRSEQRIEAGMPKSRGVRPAGGFFVVLQFGSYHNAKSACDAIKQDGTWLPYVVNADTEKLFQKRVYG